ncbi:uncharacterized protein M6B38_364520 [Iris pallida]|uniref:Uncharacterized protein n=1 Tax=Iris pallida TaxID=29817 RepID=A0AAX6GH27_IRIPA|nr:uncharacterized protein M6B38_364520 [Iris pallida]
MKEGDILLPTSKPSPAAGGGGGGGASLFGRGRYKFWALAAIILLAFWSMLTGTVTLKWSAEDFNSLSDRFLDHSPAHDDVDVLEVEEREKVVRQMWEVYSHGRLIRLPRFWREAFEAAYEELASDDDAVRDGAISEIAKMSMRMMDLDPPARTGQHPHRHDAKGDTEKNDRDGAATAKTRSTLSSAEAQ